MSISRSALSGAVSALPDAENPFALSLNENPFPPLPSVRSALVASIDSANRYPEFLPEQLRSLIAGHIGVRDEQVVIGAGATGVALQVLQAVTSPGDTLVMTSPTFDGYPIFAQMTRLRSVTVALDRHGHHDLDAMAQAAERARVIVLCRPHNPTGTIEPVDEVERFLRRVPPDTVVLLDEAYVEFLLPEHRIDAPALVERFPNVVVLRTFSRPMVWRVCASVTDSARRIWPVGCGRCSCRSASASPDWLASLPPTMRKLNCSSVFEGSRQRSAISGPGCARRASAPLTATPTSSTYRLPNVRLPTSSQARVCACADMSTALCE